MTYCGEIEKEILTLVSKIENSNEYTFEKILSDNLKFFQNNLLIIEPEGIALISKNELGNKPINDLIEIVSIIKDCIQDRYIAKITTSLDKTIIIGVKKLQDKLNIHNTGENYKEELVQKGYRITNIDGYMLSETKDNLIGICICRHKTKRFIKDNFRSEEDIRHSKELREAKWSFYVAIFAVFISSAFQLTDLIKHW